MKYNYLNHYSYLLEIYSNKLQLIVIIVDLYLNLKNLQYFTF